MSSNLMFGRGARVFGYRMGVAVLTAGLALGASAAEQTLGWNGGDGSLADPDMNSGHRALTESDILYFEHTAEGEPGVTSRVTVPDGFKFDAFNLENAWSTKWTGTAGVDDSCAVTFVGENGNPATLYQQVWKYTPKIMLGRKVILDNVQVVFTNMLGLAREISGFQLYGRMLLENGAAFVGTPSACYGWMDDTAELTVKDNSTFDVWGMNPKIGARIRFLSGTATVGNWSIYNYKYCFQTNACIRNAKVTVYNNIFDKSFFPSGKDGLLNVAHQSDWSFAPNLAGGEQIALRGKAMATNNSNSTVSKCILTNSVAFYGRGTLNAGFFRVANGRTVDIDLDTFESGYGIQAMADPQGATAAPVINFRNGVHYRMYDNRNGKSTRTSSIDTTVDFYGNIIFDVQDIYSGRKGDWWGNSCILFHDRAGFEVRGGSVTTGVGQLPVRFSRYAVGDDATLVERDYNYNAPRWRWTHDFALGKNAVLSMSSYQQVVEAIGDVTVDPSAQLIVNNMPEDIGDNVYPLFCSLGDPLPDGTLRVDRETPGASIKWVGGTAYYTKGTKTYPYQDNWGFWLGGADDKWSNANNWGKQTVPYKGLCDVNLCGESNLVVDVDVEEAGCLSIYKRYNGGPAILRGKSISIARGGVDTSLAAAKSESMMPLIIECPLIANVNFCCYTDVSESKGLIVLKGDVNASEGVFAPCGNIAVGGTVSCRELSILKSLKERGIRYHKYKSGSKYFTDLEILPGGKIVASDQTTANSETCGVWIAKGGTVDITGRWDWTRSENEHQIDGLLDLSKATVGGDAAQGYFGKGVVKIGETDGTAAVKLGEGITLETTAANWGTMPIEMASDLTISNETSWTYAVAGGIRVTGPGHVLTVYTAEGATTTIETGIDGYDFDIVKKGAGKLVLKGNLDGLKRGTLDVREGTVAFDQALKVTTLKNATGTALAFGAKAGTAASLFIDDDVDLSNLTFKADGDVSFAGAYTTVLTVPWDCDISGTPELMNLKLRTVVNTDGSKSLQVKAVKGLVVIFR